MKNYRKAICTVDIQYNLALEKVKGLLAKNRLVEL
jgi:hypothetical protein